MKWTAMTAVLLAAFALPVAAQEVGVTQPMGNWFNAAGLSGTYFVPQIDAWCVMLNGGYASYGGCLPEYQIPPAQLRALRATAGLPIEAPVWNGAKGEFVDLPPSE